jgi:hypothetical protein
MITQIKAEYRTELKASDPAGFLPPRDEYENL